MLKRDQTDLIVSNL